MYIINEGMIDVPGAWKDESINVLTTVQGNAMGLSFTISRDVLPWGMAFASFAKKEVDQIAANLKAHEQLALEPTQIDGAEALLSEFRWQSAQGPIHQCMVFTAREQRVLIFTGSMPGLISAEQKAQLLALIATFKFRTGPEPTPANGAGPTDAAATRSP